MNVYFFSTKSTAIPTTCCALSHLNETPTCLHLSPHLCPVHRMLRTGHQNTTQTGKAGFKVKKIPLACTGCGAGTKITLTPCLVNIKYFVKTLIPHIQTSVLSNPQQSGEILKCPDLCVFEKTCLKKPLLWFSDCVLFFYNSCKFSALYLNQSSIQRKNLYCIFTSFLKDARTVAEAETIFYINHCL